MADPVKIPWPLTTVPGFNPQEGAGRLINCHNEPLGDKPKWYRAPGLTEFTTYATAGYRGGAQVGSLFYFASTGYANIMTSTGVVTQLTGSFQGTRMISVARNQKTPTADVILCDPDNGAYRVSGTSISSFNGGGVLPQSNCVCSQDGYIFFGAGDNSVYAAGPNDLTVNALTKTVAQSRANGSLRRLVPFRGMLLIFCTTFTELYNNTANSFPAFPYSRLSVLDYGLDGYSAIAGWEDGFGHVCWVWQNGVWHFPEGSFAPEKISPPDLDRLIEAVADKTTLNAGCYAYAGKRIWSLSSPTWTWEVNLNTMKWSERTSFTSQNLLTRWRGIGGALAFDKWMVGDAQTSTIGYVDPTCFKELDSLLLWRLESMPVERFPMRSRVGRIDLDFVLGTDNPAGAVPIETNPQVMISWSKDSGRNFGMPVMRQLGPRGGAPTRRVFATGLGQTQSTGRVWRLDVTDPVYVGFLGGTMSETARAP